MTVASPFEPSPDPLLDELRKYISGIELGREVENLDQKLKPILSNQTLFRVNLFEVGLAEKVIGYFKEMIEGAGAVRKTLEKCWMQLNKKERSRMGKWVLK